VSLIVVAAETSTVAVVELFGTAAFESFACSAFTTTADLLNTSGAAEQCF